MAMSSRWTVAVVVALALAVTEAAAEVEIQTGRVTGECFGTGPISFTADPFHKFDPMAGTRRLDRVLISVGFDWECVVQLANPLPEVQEVRYTANQSIAHLITNTDCDLSGELFAIHSGTLLAEPFQTVQQLHTEHQPATIPFNLVPTDPQFGSLIGPGPIQFERFEFATSFSTRRWLNGVPFAGSPIGFSVFREQWEFDITYTYEYTIVPTPSTTTTLLIGITAVQGRRRRQLPSAGRGGLGIR